MTNSSFSAFDTAMMAQALQLAKRGLYTTHPNPRVGCVLVKHQQVIAEGWHQRAGEGHAEVMALAKAGAAAAGATAYVSLEPCSHTGKTPPCADALINAGIARVVSAMEDPNPLVAGRGHQRLRDHQITVSTGLLAEQAAVLNPGFIKRMKGGMPWVWAKSAASLDGRTALANGDSVWITGTPARQDVQRLRARCEAIVTGVDTVLQDDPAFTVRVNDWPTGEWPKGFAAPQPIRVILDSRLRMPLTARLLDLPGPVWVVYATAPDQKVQQLQERGVRVWCLPDRQGLRVDLVAVLQALAGAQVNEVLVEAGAHLIGAFLQQRLIDEWWVYQAPCLLGSVARPLVELPPLTSMDQRVALRLVEARQLGQDWRWRYRIPSLEQ